MNDGDHHEELGGADPAYEPWQAGVWRWIQLVGGILCLVAMLVMLLGCVTGQLRARDAGRAMCYPFIFIPAGLALIGNALRQFRNRRRQLDEALNLKYGYRTPDDPDGDDT